VETLDILAQMRVQKARSSLRDFNHYLPIFPALKRWAIFGRPFGAGFYGNSLLAAAAIPNLWPDAWETTTSPTQP